MDSFLFPPLEKSGKKSHFFFKKTINMQQQPLCIFNRHQRLIFTSRHGSGRLKKEVDREGSEPPPIPDVLDAAEKQALKSLYKRKKCQAAKLSSLRSQLRTLTLVGRVNKWLTKYGMKPQSEEEVHYTRAYVLSFCLVREWYQVPQPQQMQLVKWAMKYSRELLFGWLLLFTSTDFFILSLPLASFASCWM